MAYYGRKAELEEAVMVETFGELYVRYMEKVSFNPELIPCHTKFLDTIELERIGMSFSELKKNVQMGSVHLPAAEAELLSLFAGAVSSELGFFENGMN
ncbi:hypothetical protein HPP92_027966 [Vanilla planifolia]|uniref:Uncharacterized protein n=1 Tax=Vanilla planifolia TaxID=51239 RepID=A0A835U553_VANPL|nr:hypothetical protein HPP92_027966 [Vanilla planifolia]